MSLNLKKTISTTLMTNVVTVAGWFVSKWIIARRLPISLCGRASNIAEANVAVHSANAFADIQLYRNGLRSDTKTFESLLSGFLLADLRPL
ncbi:hypothetical protein FQN54_004007 [Arachnomyces sp. PD_36]|nr:hypothetical protein FQN54_004007 [Arachnomyces sp. PD_36]